MYICKYLLCIILQNNIQNIILVVKCMQISIYSKELFLYLESPGLSSADRLKLHTIISNIQSIWPFR